MPVQWLICRLKLDNFSLQTIPWDRFVFKLGNLSNLNWRISVADAMNAPSWSSHTQYKDCSSIISSVVLHEHVTPWWNSICSHKTPPSPARSGFLSAFSTHCPAAFMCRTAANWPSSVPSGFQTMKYLDGPKHETFFWHWKGRRGIKRESSSRLVCVCVCVYVCMFYKETCKWGWIIQIWGRKLLKCFDNWTTQNCLYETTIHEHVNVYRHIVQPDSDKQSNILHPLIKKIQTS